jgi:hypothetical protein
LISQEIKDKNKDYYFAPDKLPSNNRFVKTEKIFTTSSNLKKVLKKLNMDDVNNVIRKKPLA